MNLRPDYLFLQSSALIYFCGWLWLSVSTAVIPVRKFAKRPLGVAVGIVLVVSAVVWGYLFIDILAVGLNPIEVPLTTELILIVVMATTYFPLKPWSSHAVEGTPQFVRVARIELVAVLIGLPIASTAIIVPFGFQITATLPTLVGDNPVLCVLIAGLALYWIAVCQPRIRLFLLGAFAVMIALATTYIMMFTILIAAV